MDLQNIKAILLSKIPRQFTVHKPEQLVADIYLPTELWLDILAYLSMDDMQALSLTSASLKEIAQPFLFRSVSMHPFQGIITYRDIKLKSYMARCLKRLEFLTSPRIASSVREFALQPYPRGHFLSRTGPPQVPINEIVERVFDSLCLFPNLEILVIQFISSVPQRLEVLKNLRLNVLEFETRGDDITWANGLATPIPARHRCLFNCNTGPNGIPLHFLYPTTIRNISAGPNGTESILEAMALSALPFRSLHSLDLWVRLVSTPTFIGALQHCQNLGSLRLRSNDTDIPAHVQQTMTSLLPDYLPRLTSYHGPSFLAPAFAGGRSLLDVKLWSSRRQSLVESPEVLATVVPRLGRQVRLLEIGVTDVPPFLIDVLQNSLPHLKTLSINAHVVSRLLKGTLRTHTIQTSLTTTIGSGILSGGKYRLETLNLGAQLGDPEAVTDASRAETAALEALASFPKDYDLSSWRQWRFGDLPWSKIIWTRLSRDDDFGDSGKISIEYTECLETTFAPIIKD